MTNYILTKVQDAQPDQLDDTGTKTKSATPAIFQYTPLLDAIDEKGLMVKIKGETKNIRATQLDNQIARLESELAASKTVRADMDNL